jgi:hypothetical protein
MWSVSCLPYAVTEKPRFQQKFIKCEKDIVAHHSYWWVCLQKHFQLYYFTRDLLDLLQICRFGLTRDLPDWLYFYLAPRFFP